jgi:hypothetical protein
MPTPFRGGYDRQFFVKIRRFRNFQNAVSLHFGNLVAGTALKVELCPVRLNEAHKLWLEDLRRVSKREMRDGILDHFKQSAHLVFWLKRQSPAIYWDTSEVDFINISRADRYLIDFLLRYGNEFVPFRLGYETSLFYECFCKGMARQPSRYAIGPTYVREVCHLLKTKSVSPHALYLIYRSLFNRPDSE